MQFIQLRGERLINQQARSNALFFLAAGDDAEVMGSTSMELIFRLNDFETAFFVPGWKNVRSQSNNEIGRVSLSGRCDGVIVNRHGLLENRVSLLEEHNQVQAPLLAELTDRFVKILVGRRASHQFGI